MTHDYVNTQIHVIMQITGLRMNFDPNKIEIEVNFKSVQIFFFWYRSVQIFYWEGKQFLTKKIMKTSF